MWPEHLCWACGASTQASQSAGELPGRRKTTKMADSKIIKAKLRRLLAASDWVATQRSITEALEEQLEIGPLDEYKALIKVGEVIQASLTPPPALRECPQPTG